MKFNKKNIILCLTGSIAAYKAVMLASLLKKNGANVISILTKNARKFITPLTLKSITENKVVTSQFDESDFIPHISLAQMADLVVVAPATANIIAKLAAGIADDMTTSLVLSTKAKKMIIPAMNTEMYLNPITQKNIETLKHYGFSIMTPDTGLLACNTEGIGRFPDVNKIYDFMAEAYDTPPTPSTDTIFKGKKVLITAGGTIEDIDPVRYISNRSSGRMGLAFATAFIHHGSTVTLITGNMDNILLKDFKNRNPYVEIIPVRSAQHLQEKITAIADNFDIFVMAAAVADYTVDYSDEKIKKGRHETLQLSLKKTPDILAGLKKRKNALYIGFAAETENLLDNARNKLVSKKLNFILANTVTGEKSALGQDQAEVYILNQWDEKEILIPYNTKETIAESTLLHLQTIIKQYLPLF